MEDDRKRWGWRRLEWPHLEVLYMNCHIELLQTEGSENSCMEGEWSCLEKLVELPKKRRNGDLIYGRRMELPLTEGLEKSCREDAWNCHRRTNWRSHVWKANGATTDGRNGTISR